MTDANTPVLEARNAAYLRQDEPVFAPVSFSLHRGELAVIEGDNGSGKTTLLRAVAGWLHLSEGELLWRGEPMQPDACRGEIAVLGHRLGLKGDLTAQENIDIAIGLHGANAGVDAHHALADAGLRGYQHEPVRRLSAGQQKRVALARLSFLPTTLWLLDEPLANLDVSGHALVKALVARHLAGGGAALMTSHGAADLYEGAKRIRMQA